jgi:hypothetical protein
MLTRQHSYSPDTCLLEESNAADLQNQHIENEIYLLRYITRILKHILQVTLHRAIESFHYVPPLSQKAISNSIYILRVESEVLELVVNITYLLHLLPNISRQENEAGKIATKVQHIFLITITG